MSSIETLAADALITPVSLWQWQRSLPATLAAFVSDLVHGPEFQIRIDVDVDSAAPAVARRLADAGIGEPTGSALLADDIARLGRLYASVSGHGHLQVRIEHDGEGRCPLFHEDNNALRLLCTYAGPGTEWLPEASVDRTQLGLRRRTMSDANRAIATGSSEHAAPGDVLILKGSQYRADHRSAVHRSPSPELGDRVLLAIDRSWAVIRHRWHKRPR